MRLNIVLLPPSNVRIKVGSLAINLQKKYPLKLVVDNKKFIPHITMFQFHVREDSLKQVNERLEIVSKTQKPLIIKSKGSGGSVRAFATFDYNLERTGPLASLHKKIIENFALFRTKDTKSLSNSMSLWEKKNLKRNGMPKILKLFRPHITIGVLKDPSNLERVASAVKKYPLSAFDASKIALTRINQYGQVYKILKIFKFK